MATEKLSIRCFGSGMDVYGDEWETQGGNPGASNNVDAARGLKAKCPRCDRWIGVQTAGIMADELRLRSHTRIVERAVRS